MATAEELKVFVDSLLEYASPALREIRLELHTYGCTLSVLVLQEKSKDRVNDETTPITKIKYEEKWDDRTNRTPGVRSVWVKLDEDDGKDWHRVDERQLEPGEVEDTILCHDGKWRPAAEAKKTDPMDVS